MGSRPLGDARRADRPASQSDQSACDQAKDVEVEEETSRASAPSAVEENLSRDSSYDTLNGIALSPRVWRVHGRGDLESGAGPSPGPSRHLASVVQPHDVP